MRHQSVHQWFEEQVCETPDAIAVVFGHEQLTYQQLNERANQLAHHLQKLGVEPEKLVGICIERSPMMVVALLAVLKAGGAYVPLDPSYPSDRLAYMLTDAQVHLLLTTANLPETDSAISSSHQEYVIVDVDRQWETISQQSTQNPVSLVKQNHLAYVLYTSGSTGKAKGVMMEHLALVNLINWHLHHRLSGVKALQFASLSFDISFHEIFSTWCSGGEAKAGALNAALREVRNLFPNIEYIETRDCDDCVGDPQFLRKCTTYLINHPTLGLVQTYKETELTDHSDPFDTREMFLQSYTLPGKISLGGVLSLGSGVVYRQQALVDAGGFDGWNIGEDMTTTVRILQKGWTSQALDLVGVLSQAPVTDLENFLKQRSVWSLNALRLMFFAGLSGLSLKQRLAFCTKGIKELLYPTSVFLLNVTIAISLIVGEPMFLSVPPITIVAIAFMTLFELLFFKGNILFGWKHKTLELALLFANLKMVWVAIVNGRNKKPKYVVTRKTAKHQSYLRYCRLHIALLILLIMGIVRVVSTGIALEHSIFLVAAIYWSIRLIDVMRLALYQPQTN
ncbi:AMP-binding protein [Nodularia spumigena]|uniref:AMP-binding protein n=1 Tax=Nodularia spumigena TaxID=70799 RepID=UPI00232B7F9C|nr:AMP-binding protein [Nodularia spumigena]MDB9317734.1 AMP-binding protein [Nodularia spumigena CS-590/01A]MDB9322847.1 AMP-binding protein [Nodularia spumigena CS-591/07A]MDB9325833.1 AMP-binding protein [Nodularia spumigena CS-590/02]MDB9330339.1 AMP-binding protein [Nodularia spumigena CS-591/04]MDB9336671.1 AMP-binding protein [Nodularia spumigena CS-590/01]